MASTNVVLGCLYQTYGDLDFLAGTWSQEQAKEFMDAVLFFDQVEYPPLNTPT